MADEPLPFVSVIMPIRNEADFIEQAVRSVLDNDYPSDKMEVIVADGCSDDGTQAIVEKISSSDSRVTLIRNQGKIVSTGLNLGLKACRGDVFIRVDGHAHTPPDFIKKSVKCLIEHPDAWIAGGRWETVSNGYIGEVIAAAALSPIGVGNAKYRLSNYDGWVDTLPYGAHRRWILEKVGYFDEELLRNQDDDFNLRVILAGGKIWLSSSIYSTYYARSSLRKLWRQYFQYGFWRTRTLQKHRMVASFRQLVPLLFVVSLIVLGCAGFLWQVFWWLLGAEIVMYALGLLYGTVDVGRKAGWKYTLLAPIVFVILHFAYGLGSLWGIVRFVILRGRGMKKPQDAKLSR